MIYHNTKIGFPSSILNEQYNLNVVRTYFTRDHKIRKQRFTADVCVTHDMFGSSLSIRLDGKVYVITMDKIINDMFGSSLSIRLDGKVYVITMDKIINDIMEVEHENETLYADR